MTNYFFFCQLFILKRNRKVQKKGKIKRFFFFLIGTFLASDLISALMHHTSFCLISLCIKKTPLFFMVNVTAEKSNESG